jgi:ATP-binding cassette, subfamily B, bacterial
MQLADCGAACLAMVLAYHGKQVPLDELREMTNTNRDGVDALAMTQAAQQYGLRARGVAADVDDLEHLPPATILHWEFLHFVVFERLRRNGVQVVDPAHGRRRLSMEVFRRSYTGVAITFEPGEDFQPSTLNTKGTWRYLRPLLGQSQRLTRVLVGSVLLRLLALALPLLIGLLVNEIVPRNDRHLLLVTGATMGAVVGYFFLATLLRSHLLLQLRTRLDVRLTMAFVEHLVDLPYAFFLGRSAGDLMMRLQSNTVVREFLTTGTIAALIDGGLASLYLVLLFMLSPPLAALVLGLGLLQVLVLLLSWRRNQHLMSESLQVEAKSQSYTFELLAGIETLKAAGAERRAAEHWERLFIDQVNVALRRGRLEASVDSVIGTLQLGSPLAILIYGGFQVLNGGISLGTMLAAAALAAGFLEPLATLIQTGLQMQLLRSYMERINDVLDAPREQEGQTVATAPRLTGRIQADGVSFAYGGPLAPQVVKDVSLEVQPGQLLGIVGRSGSGKSTLAHLLLGIYPPTSGRVLFDGRDLAELELRSLRRQIGIVTQRPYLFGGTIRQNIALSDPGMPHQAVVEAAKLACIHDEIVAMPMGYETRLVDGGASLSGGQQQRIALARALAHRPTILLLDEATSDLDGVTERMVHHNLSALGCSRIVIAHRLSTIVDADLILVMEEGRIVQQGTHDELMALAGAYRQQAEAQLGSTSAAAPFEIVEPWPPVTDAPVAPVVDRPGPDAGKACVSTGGGPDAAKAPVADAAKAPAASARGTGVAEAPGPEAAKVPRPDERSPAPAKPAGPSKAGPGTATPARDRGQAERADRDRAAARAAWTWRGRRFRPRPAPSQAPSTTEAPGTQAPAAGPAAEGSPGPEPAVARGVLMAAEAAAPPVAERKVSPAVEPRPAPEAERAPAPDPKALTAAAPPVAGAKPSPAEDVEEPPPEAQVSPGPEVKARPAERAKAPPAAEAKVPPVPEPKAQPAVAPTAPPAQAKVPPAAEPKARASRPPSRRPAPATGIKAAAAAEPAAPPGDPADRAAKPDSGSETRTERPARVDKRPAGSRPQPTAEPAEAPSMKDGLVPASPPPSQQHRPPGPPERKPAPAAAARPPEAPAAPEAPKPPHATPVPPGPAAPAPTHETRPAASTKPAASTPNAPAAKEALVPAATGIPTAKEQPAAGTTERPSDQDRRDRQGWNLRRFISSRRPETPERKAPAPRGTGAGEGLDRLTQSIESATEALGGQAPDFYERDLPQIAASEIAKRVRADVIVLLLDNGQGIMEVSGEVGLNSDERHMRVEYSRDIMRELFRAGVGLVEDTARIRGALAGIPGCQAETLVMVPLVHERLGFGVLMAGRERSTTGTPAELFTDTDVQALLGFADGVAPSLRTAVLLRHLKVQLSALEDG